MYSFFITSYYYNLLFYICCIKTLLYVYYMFPYPYIDVDVCILREKESLGRGKLIPYTKILIIEYFPK